MAEEFKTDPNEPIIRLEDVTVTFKTRTGSILHPNKIQALKGVSLSLMPGETIGLVGESGCGKSTTANVMIGLQKPTTGKVYFKGVDVTNRTAADRRRIGRVISVVFQDPATALNARMSIHDQLLDPMLVHKIGDKESREKRVYELIEQVGLPMSVMDALPGQLSGGQRQRVAIARALSLQPDAIIADEPTSALDVSVRAQILNLLMDLKKDLGLAMVFISHDIQTVRYISDRIIVMNGGRPVEEGTAEQVFNNPRDEYTKLLLGAAPSLLYPDLGKYPSCSKKRKSGQMDPKCIKGVIPPVVIPLTAERTLDLKSFSRNINRMIDAGVDGLFFLGSSGEVAFLTDAQRQHVLQEAVSIVRGRVPVLAGIIDMETLRVIDQAKRAEAIGVDGLVATAPFYALGGPKETERHFRAIRENTELPLFAYDLPVCVHTKLDPTMLVRLGKDGVLQGVKDSSGDDVSFRWLVLENEDAGHPLQLLTGHEVCVDGAYLAGADGSVPGLANVDPYTYVEMWRAYQAGDWAKVKELQDHVARLMFLTRVVKATVGFGAGVGAFKTALWQMGIFETNQMREPVQPLVGDDVEAIVKVLKTAGLIAEDQPVRA